MQIAAGSQLGVESEIGASGMAAFLARDTGRHRLMAIKILLSDTLGGAGLREEGDHCLRVESSAHPHRSSDGAVEGQPYLVTEFDTGEQLGNMSPRRARRRAAGLARALVRGFGEGLCYDCPPVRG